MDPQTAVILAGAIAAGFVQGLSGFGFGLVAMSIWAWTLDPKLAAVLAVCGGCTGQVVAAITVRRGFDGQRLWPFIAGGLLGIPLGIVVLPLLDVHLFKIVLGLILILCCPAMLLANRLPHVVWGGRWGDALAGWVGGAMSGIGGFSGIAPTLWCTLRGYDRDAQRSVIQTFNLTVLMVTTLTYVATGLINTTTLPWLAMVLPAMLVPSLLGARVYIGLSPAAFRQIVLGLLSVSGLAMLASEMAFAFNIRWR
jgi:uncharacterized protein